MPVPFDKIWELAEQFHIKKNFKRSSQEIVEELHYKLNLYNLLENKELNLPEEERQKAKSHTFGEILLTLTNLSLRDNVNVYEALQNSLNGKI